MNPKTELLVNQAIQTIIDTIKEDIKDDKDNNALFERIRKVVARFEGKKITKAIATAVKKELGPTYNIYYSSEYTFYQLKIWTKKFDDHKSFILGYHSSPIFTLGSYEENKGFDYHNCWAGRAAVERIAENEKILSNRRWLEALTDDVLTYKRLRESLENRFNGNDFPAKYAVKRALGLEL